MEDFNLTAFCEAATEGAGEAACTVQENLDDASSGLNAFFLLFAVRTYPVVQCQLSSILVAFNGLLYLAVVGCKLYCG